MNGLSSTALQKTTNFAQPSESLSFVRKAVSFMTAPISFTASMLMPERLEPRLTEEQTRSVTASASGTELMSFWSEAAVPFWTSAENPPMKLTPTSAAARSSVRAIST